MAEVTIENMPKRRKQRKYDYFCEKCKKPFHMQVGSFILHAKNCGTERERFWTRIEKQSNGCWIFLGCRDKWGYAQYGVKCKRHQAHRYSYELTHGPIPKGMLVRHSCDNPPCVNPEHLSLGTDADNRADSVSKGRHAWGERSNQAKLTVAKVIEIRRLYAGSGQGRPSNAGMLAAKFGVDRGTIAAVALGRTWKNVK